LYSCFPEILKQRIVRYILLRTGDVIESYGFRRGYYLWSSVSRLIKWLETSVCLFRRLMTSFHFRERSC